MLDIYKLSPRNFSPNYLDGKLLDYFEANGNYPYCINLNREQMEQLLNMMEAPVITDIKYRGIPVIWYIEKKSDSNNIMPVKAK